MRLLFQDTQHPHGGVAFIGTVNGGGVEEDDIGTVGGKGFEGDVGIGGGCRDGRDFQLGGPGAIVICCCSA